MADFGVLHRKELSGALPELTRVRRFQQDDAYIFRMPEQVRSHAGHMMCVGSHAGHMMCVVSHAGHMVCRVTCRSHDVCSVTCRSHDVCSVTCRSHDVYPSIHS